VSLLDRRSDEDEPLFTGYKGGLSLLLSAGWSGTLLGRELLPPLLPEITRDLSLSPTRAGFALTVLWGTYAVTHYPSGRLSDKLTRTTIVVTGLTALILGFGTITQIRSYTGLLVGVMIVSVGAGLFFVPSRALLSDLYLRRRGQVLGIQVAAGNLGSMFAAGLAAVGIGVVSWQTLFFPVIVVIFTVLVAVHLWSREGYAVNRIDFDVRETSVDALRKPSVRWLLLTYVLYAFVLTGVFGFLPTFLQVEKDWTPLYASAGFALLFLVGAVCGPIAGRLGDHLSHLFVVVGSLAIGTVGVAVLITAPTVAYTVGSLALIAVGLRSFPPVMQAHLLDTFSDDSVGGNFGALKTVYNLVGSLGPTYVGVVSDVSTYTVAFASLIPVLLAATAVILWRYSKLRR
jgi:MFS family permease